MVAMFGLINTLLSFLFIQKNPEKVSKLGVDNSMLPLSFFLL